MLFHLELLEMVIGLIFTSKIVALLIVIFKDFSRLRRLAVLGLLVELFLLLIAILITHMLALCLI